MPRRIVRIALLLLVSALIAGPVAASGPALTEAGRALDLVPLAGTPPAFALTVLDGGHIRLADLSGRPALLYFWATW